MEKIGERGGEAKKRKKTYNSCRRDVRNGGDVGGNKKKRKHENVGSEAADSNNLEKWKEAGREGPNSQGLRKNCKSRVCTF